MPVRGRKLHNANGTAPGMLFEAKAGGKVGCAAARPARRAAAHVLNEVKPWLAGLTDLRAALACAACGRALAKATWRGKVAHLLAGENPTAALYAKTGEVFIRITAKAQDAAAAEAMCRAFAGEFYAVLGDAIYGEDSEMLAAAAVHALRENGRHGRHGRKLHRAGCSAALTDAGRKRGVWLWRLQLSQRTENACAGRFGRNVVAVWRRLAETAPKWRRACAAPPGPTLALASPALLAGRRHKRKAGGACIWPRHAKIRYM